MNTQQVDPVHGRHYEDDPSRSRLLHSVFKGEDEQQGKGSVLKKMKNKAKKLKETLTKHGHSGGQDEEENEGSEEEPEVHGAPMYESEAGRKFGNIQEEKSGQTGANLVNTGPFKENPHAPKETPEAFSPPNYETKVTDPTAAGGEEIGATLILRSFEAMKVIEEPETGSHDQFPSDPTADKATDIPQNSQSVPESFNTHGEHEEQSTKNPQSVPKSFNTHREQEEQSTKNPQLVLESFNSHAEQEEQSTKNPQLVPENFNSHREQEEQLANVDNSSSTKSLTVSAGDYGRAKYPRSVPESFNSHREQEEQSTKNPQSVPESFNTDGEQEEQSANADNSSSTKSLTASAGDYGYKIATTVTEKLAPVYEKVTEAGSAVISKMQVTNTEGSSGEGGSMKGFFAERLRPGDEDRALSEVITEVIHKRKEEESEEVLDSPKAESGSSEKEEKVTNWSQSVGMGVVDKLKGAVTSLFGKGSETHASPREGEAVGHEKVT